MKKQIVRLTESDLHNIIKESVSKLLNERNFGEKGLTNAEVSDRRDRDFEDEIQSCYGDSIYDDEQTNHRDKIHSLRKQHHYATQRHIRENNSHQIDPNYTHYAVNKLSGKIVNGWNYSDVDGSELREFKRDYFFQDLIDYDLNPKDYKILTKRNVEKLGIDINDWNNWANS